VVRGAGRQDLPVCRLVREERDLRVEDAEGARDEELIPAGAEQDEAGDAAAEGEGDQPSDDHVEDRCAAQQAALTDHLRDIGECPRQGRELVCPGVRLTDGAEPRLEGGWRDKSTYSSDRAGAKGGCRSLS